MEHGVRCMWLSARGDAGGIDIHFMSIDVDFNTSIPSQSTLRTLQEMFALEDQGWLNSFHFVYIAAV